MRASTIAIFIVGLVVGHSALASDQVIYSIQISTKRPVVMVGDKIRITVNARNATDGDVPFNHVIGEGEAEFDNEIVLHDQDGRIPIKTRFYSRLTQDVENLPPLADGSTDGPITSSGTSIWLAPRESYKDSFVLNKLYELANPGTYTVEAVRTVRFRDGREYEIYSNSLVITVLPQNQ